MASVSSSRGGWNERTLNADIDEENVEDDTPDAHIQDQLPTDEEDGAASDSRRRKSHSALYYVAAFLGIAILVAIIVLPIVLTQDKGVPAALSNDNSSPSPVSTPPAPVPLPSLASSMAPVTTPAPAQTPATVPLPTLAPLDRRGAVIRHLATVGISSEDSMTTPNTPQYRAVEWIVNDELQLPVPVEENRYSHFVERYVLAVLYFSTNGSSWQHQVNFLSGEDHCNWYGDFVANNGRTIRIGIAECANIESLGEVNTDRFVTSLSLPMNNLNGTLPSEIQYLHRLEKLLAPNNSRLTGDLSFGLHQLLFLEDVSIQYCGLTGTIPDQLGNLQSLTSLGLANNDIVGSIPSDFFSLTNLEVLFLDDNLIEGNVEDFRVFNKLQALYIEDNLFTGQFTPAMVANWSNSMVDLDMSMNMINSTLPEALFAMTYLIILDLHGNSFHGPIPEISSAQFSLSFIALHVNELTGVIPESIRNLSNLEHLDVSVNNLQLPLPNTLGELTDLVYLFTGHNNFSTHAIPGWLWSLTNLEELSMKDSSLTGEIPSEIGTLTRLQLLDLDSNELEGTIPSEMGNIASLRFLLLNRNNLSGPIPSSFASLVNLDLILLDHNEMNGTADVFCSNENINIGYLVADCEDPNPSIECSCCALCCSQSNATCNQLNWNANLDPVWEHGYSRDSFIFSIDTVVAGTGD